MTKSVAFVTSLGALQRTQFAVPFGCGAASSPAWTSQMGTNPPHSLHVIAQHFCVFFTNLRGEQDLKLSC